MRYCNLSLKSLDYTAEAAAIDKMRQWDINQPPAPLPPIQSTRPAEGVTLLLPLTHRGYGPGLIILVPDTARSLDIVDGVPSPAIKWAEEGYCVVEIQESAFATSRDLFTTAIETLNDCQECESGAVGLVGKFPDRISRHMAV